MTEGAGIGVGVGVGIGVGVVIRGITLNSLHSISLNAPRVT